jgi:AcrR family transcriptional regulator
VVDIAASAGVAHGLLFHYFGSKRGIYLEAMRAAADQIGQSFDFDTDEPPARQVRPAVTSLLTFLATHRGLALRLILGGRGADPEAWEVFEAGRWRTVEATLAAMGLDPQRASFRMAGRAMVSVIDEAAIYWLQNGEPFDIDVLVDWMIETASFGVRAAERLDASAAAMKSRSSGRV